MNRSEWAPFHDFAVSTAWWATGFVLFGLAGLIVSSLVGLGPAWATALGSVFGGILAVGLVTLVFEFRLRRTFGDDLNRFLKLKEALVLSGLTSIGPAHQVDDRSTFTQIQRIAYIGRSPTNWLNEHLPSLLRVAEADRLRITVALPDPENEQAIETAAASLGIESEALSNAIRSFRSSAESQWAVAEERLAIESELRLIYLTVAPSFDTFLTDGALGLFLAKPLSQAVGDDMLALRFEAGHDALPMRWIASAFESLERDNAILHRVKKEQRGSDV